MKLNFKIYQEPDADFEIDAEASETIADLKAKIKDSQGYDVDKQGILFCGKGLDDDRTLESYRISEKGFLVLLVDKPKPPVPIPRELDAEEYFSLDEDGLAEHMGMTPLSKLVSTSDSGLTFKYDPMSISALGPETASTTLPPITTVSTFRYRTWAEIMAQDISTPASLPPVTTVSTSKHLPLSSSFAALDSETASASFPPVTTVSTFKYRPWSEIMAQDISTPASLPPVTTVSTSKHLPLSSSFAALDSEIASKSFPPVTTVSTFKYRPWSEIMAQDISTPASVPPIASASVPPVTTVSTFKYRPWSEIMAQDITTPTSVPPATTVSTSKHLPLSSSFSALDSETASASFPPVTTVSTFKYRSWSEIMAQDISTPTSVPPVTTVSASKHLPLSSSFAALDSETASASVPPVTTVSTFKYRPWSEIMAQSNNTSASVAPVTTVSTLKYRPMSSSTSGPVPASTSASTSGSTWKYTPMSSSGRVPAASTSTQQGSTIGAGMVTRPGSGGSGSAPGRPGEPQMAQFRELITQNPALREHFVQQLAQENPELGELLTQNPDLLFQFLDRIGEDGGAGPSAQATRLSVTEAERGAIERLEALGFPKQSVIEAYFACDKNEELAANYLLENA